VFCERIVVFVAGSCLCVALSSTLAAFVAARFLQGIGGAMMVPVGRLVLLRACRRTSLVAALNYLTIPALLGPVTGPALGGAITLYFSTGARDLPHQSADRRAGALPRAAPHPEREGAPNAGARPRRVSRSRESGCRS